ncbi:VCBS domain-containing protein [Marinomonas sp.]
MSDINVTTEQPIGYLEINANGQVEITSSNGAVRLAGNSDLVFFGDVIRSIDNSSGRIIFFDGEVQVIDFGPDDVVVLNEEVYKLNDLDGLAQDSATDAALLQAAILEGVDPTLIQDPTAAGEGIEEDGSIGSTPTVHREQSSFIFENTGLFASEEGFSLQETMGSEYNLPDIQQKNQLDQSPSLNLDDSEGALANSAPVAQSASIAVLEDNSFLGQIITQDADAKDQGNLTFNVINPTKGFSLISSGAYVFNASDYDSLSKDQTLTLDVFVRVTDTSSASSIAQISVTITGTNDAPTVAVAQQYLSEGGQLTGQLFANDVDQPADEQLIFSLVTQVDGLALNADGSYKFDTSNYPNIADGTFHKVIADVLVTDDEGGSVQTSLTFVIIGKDHIGIISGDSSGTVFEDAIIPSVTGSLAISDEDNGESAFVGQNNMTTNYGTFSLTTSGLWEYTLTDSPEVQKLGEGEYLNDVVTISSLGGDTQSITITIKGTNDGPVAVNDTITIFEDASPIYIDVLNNDTDIDINDVLEIKSVVVTAGLGTVDIVNGKIKFTPAGNFNGEVSLSYVVSDGVASDTGIVTIIVTAVDDKAVLEIVETPSITENTAAQGTAVAGISLTDEDTDMSSVTVKFTVNGNPDGYYAIENGQVVLTQAGADHVNAGNNLPGFSITTDGLNPEIVKTSTPAAITVVDDEAILVITNASAITENTAAQGTAVAGISLTDEDTDISSVTVKFTVNGNPDGYYAIENGQVVLTQAGADHVNAGNNLPGFSITTDGLTPEIVKTSTPAAITTVNDAPTIENDSVTIQEDSQTIIIDVLANDSDEDGDTLTLSSVSVAAQYGTAVIENGKVHFTPALNYNGQAVINYVVSDGELTSQGEVNVTINPVDDISIISGNTIGFVVEEDSRKVVDDNDRVYTTGKLTVTDVDEGDNPSFVTTNVEKGVGVVGNLTINAVGEWEYTVNNTEDLQHLAQGQTLTETFTVFTDDGLSETVSIIVFGTNDDPIISSNANISINEDFNLVPQGNVSISDVDDNENPSFESQSILGKYGELNFTKTADGEGTWRFILDSEKAQELQIGMAGLDAFGRYEEKYVLTATDGSKYTVTVYILPDNDAPVVTASESFSVLEDSAVISGAVGATDVDNEDLTYSLNNGDQAGFTLFDNGTWAFDPNHVAFDGLEDGATENLVVEVLVSDGDKEAMQSINIQVTGSSEGVNNTDYSQSSNPVYLVSEAGDTHLTGSQANDWLIGSQGNNTLYGSSGADTIEGGDGDDILIGGSLNQGDSSKDLLIGGSGSDTFVIQSHGQENNASNSQYNDLVKDFNSAEDLLDLTDLLDNLDGKPGTGAGASEIETFLSEAVKANGEGVEVNGHAVATFGDTSSFETSTVKIIYNDQEYNINIDG